MRIRLAILLLACAGCGATAGARWDDVQGVEWALVKMEGAPILAGTEISLTFDVGRLYGIAINRYSAQYERTADVLLIDTVATTKKFLDHPPGAMAQEARYRKLLAETDGWRFGGGWIELTRRGETILSFRRLESEARG